MEASDSNDLRRVGVIGDVHAEDWRLETALGFLHHRRCDALLCVGDLVDGEGDADRVCTLLREHHVQTVLGNHDRWFLHGDGPTRAHATLELAESHRAWLSSLPATLSLATVAGALLLCHGVGEDDMAELRPETRGYALMEIPTLRDLMADAEHPYMVGGHTHVRMVRRFPGVTVVNAGTLHHEFAPGFIEIDFEAKTVYTFDFDGDRVVPAETLSLPDPAPL